MHTFTLLPPDPSDVFSHKHRLPWLEKEPSDLDNVIEMDVMYAEEAIYRDDDGGEF